MMLSLTSMYKLATTHNPLVWRWYKLIFQATVNLIGFATIDLLSEKNILLAELLRIWKILTLPKTVSINFPNITNFVLLIELLLSPFLVLI